jgi:hypothetical protein
MAEIVTSMTASGILRRGPGYYKGALVTTALSAAAITIYDNTAASGKIIAVIPASSAIGYRDISPDINGIRVDNGIYCSFGGTGTVTFLAD